MILFSYSNEDTKDEERKDWVIEGDQMRCQAPEPAPVPKNHATTGKAGFAMLYCTAMQDEMKKALPVIDGVERR
jgi:hypothetical protein